MKAVSNANEIIKLSNIFPAEFINNKIIVRKS